MRDMVLEAPTGPVRPVNAGWVGQFERQAVCGPDGTVYPSRAAAARSLGVSYETIRVHLARFGDLARIGPHVVRCLHQGRIYPSLSALCRSTGLSRSAVNYHVRRYGHLDYAGVGRGGRVVDNGMSRSVAVGPMSWPSISAAARDLGVPMTTLYNWLSPKASPEQRQRLLARVMSAHARKSADLRKQEGRS